MTTSNIAERVGHNRCAPRGATLGRQIAGITLMLIASACGSDSNATGNSPGLGASGSGAGTAGGSPALPGQSGGALGSAGGERSSAAAAGGGAVSLGGATTNSNTGGATPNGGANVAPAPNSGGASSVGGGAVNGGALNVGGAQATGGASPAVGGAGGSTQLGGLLLDVATFKHHVDLFNTNDADEAKPKSIPNAESWNWITKNAPLFDASNEKLEQIYYFRWWTFRKHITKQDGYSGFVMTEFYSWGSANSSAFGHQVAEGRWMRDKTLLDELTLFWYRSAGGEKFHKYSQWSTDALYKRYLVNYDKPFIVDLVDDLVDDYKAWEKSHKLPSGLFWSYDVRDAMEESISGSRTVQNARPTKNSYMAANANALVAIAKLAGRDDVAAQFQPTFETLRKKLIDELWDPEAKFFKVQHPGGQLSDAREAIGFIPWMFGLPGPEHEEAWLQIRDPEGFLAPKGLTTAERRHPKFRTAVPDGGTCEWDGAVWPFATSQTLNALATLLRSPGTHPVDKGDYYKQLLTYATSHEREGIPHIGEYQDEVTGRWLRDEYPRSWFYNHSTFVDLVINGLVGLVPRPDDTLEVDPLVPADALDWFALDQVLYHGRLLTILWDKNGSRYGQGQGLRVYADGQLVAHAPTLTRVTGSLTP